MDSKEIEICLRQNNFSSKFFRGVYSVDKLPTKKMEKPSSFIINTDNSNGPGIHWVAIWMSKGKRIEYFDSFGLPPMNKEIIDFININGKEYIFNNKQIQSNNSKTCGKFCVIFILFRSRKISYSSFINLFFKNKKLNEYYIIKLFKGMYRMEFKKF